MPLLSIVRTESSRISYYDRARCEAPVFATVRCASLLGGVTGSGEGLAPIGEGLETIQEKAPPTVIPSKRSVG